MASHASIFTTYRVYYKTEHNPRPTFIYLSDHTNKMLGFLYFHPDEGTLPQNYLYEHPNGDKSIRLFYRISQFKDIIDLLRNEKPLFIYIDEERKFGYIGTNSAEPIGDLEEEA